MQIIEELRPTDAGGGDRPHIWLQEEGGGHATATALVQTSTPAEAGRAIVPFAPPATYPFIPGPVETFWINWKPVVRVLLALFGLAGTILCALLALVIFDGWVLRAVAAIAAILFVLGVVLIAGNGLSALMTDVSEGRGVEAVHGYLRTSGWTSEGEGAALTWYRDLGLGVGLLQLKCLDRVGRLWGVCGQCHQRDYEQLAANLRAADPGLNINTDYGCYGLTLIDLAAPPREDARLDELGYGQSGWIGEAAVLSRRGDPAYSAYTTGMIHRKAYVRQARDEGHNVLVYVAYCTGAGSASITMSASKIDEASARAVERARREGAPAGTLFAVVKQAYRDEKTPAMLLKLDEEGGQ